MDSEEVSAPRRPIPWRRLLVEGGTIVVSILLAFAIDAGWEARNERQEERDLLASLTADFRMNREAAAATRARHVENFDRFVRFQRLSSAELARLDEVQVAAIYRSFAAPWTFDPLRGTLDTLISSGKFGLIRDSELQRALIAFLNLRADSEEDARYMSNAAEIAWNGYVAHGGPWRRAGVDVDAPLPVLDAATLRAIREDPQLMGLLRLHLQSAERYVGELEVQIEAIERVLLLLGDRPS
ncbi:MAG: hypothetical protein AAGE01_02140 [Pseudomonadota bacterium]